MFRSDQTIIQRTCLPNQYSVLPPGLIYQNEYPEASGHEDVHILSLNNEVTCEAWMCCESGVYFVSTGMELIVFFYYYYYYYYYY
jgi:hypothetical protein